MAAKPEKMTQAQALTLAALVLDFEAETTARSNRAWCKECNAAAQVVRQLLAESGRDSVGAGCHRGAKPPPDSDCKTTGKLCVRNGRKTKVGATKKPTV